MHALARRLNPDGLEAGFLHLKIYGVTIGVTFVPLLISAWFSSPPLIHATPAHPLTLLHDWNILFSLLVTFPTVCTLASTDQALLVHSLNAVQAQGALKISETESDREVQRWNRIFRVINLFAQTLGVFIGGTIAFFNYKAYISPQVGFWIADQGKLAPVGYVFLFFIFVFYAVLTHYAIRVIAIALLLRDLVRHARFHMLPLHPDRSGGLRPVGQLGLRNQYGLTVIGINIVLFGIVDHLYLNMPAPLIGLIIAAVVAYAVLGPLLFVAPLLPFREGMKRNKTDLLRTISQRTRIELDRLSKEFESGSISPSNENLLVQLQKIGSIVEGLPVWPFDAATFRKFATAYIIPISFPLAKGALDLAGIKLPF